MNADDHDDKRLLHYASLHPSMVHIELPALFKAKSGSSPFTDDSTAGMVSPLTCDFVNPSAPLKQKPLRSAKSRSLSAQPLTGIDI